jgi:hypothetical protein
MNDLVDKIYVISTKKSTRHDNIRNHLNQFTTNYEILKYTPASSIINNGQTNSNTKQPTLLDLCRLELPTNETSENIAQNHYNTVKLAYENNYNMVMILEDDAEFEKDIPNNITEWIKDNQNTFDIFYLGYFTWPIGIIPINLYIGKLLANVTCNHAYILNRSGMKKIIDGFEKSYKNNQHIDLFYNKIGLSQYGAYPSIAFQNNSPALIEHLNLPVPFKTLTRINETLNIIIPVIIIIIIVIIIIRNNYSRE